MPLRGLGSSNVTTSQGTRAVTPMHNTVGTLASELANASPRDQKTMLGVNLYPLVGQLEPAMASKVTDMLLEMDQTEVLHLLESPESLATKVKEAMAVLTNAPQRSKWLSMPLN
ncbi:polyadenylate-binding protein 8 [Salvia miltiorrhiza]|uniref:polyadenylate-binding protein 8 n=1 Tax=Salvia miltiorrhiza TaxID=226208 RepID=UPI0025AC2E80|nr:polyadenylate-binding protein 8 [Salvia miltiorrhiza]